MTERSPRDPDEPDVERAAAANEEEGDGLRAMRSVWLSMRDEDPPAAGLAELMAAARAKATEMTPAPWWRRALVALRRPPVMALATAVVVLGGAVLVTTRVRHEDAMPVAQERVAQGARTPAAGGPARDAVAAPADELDDIPAGGGRAAAGSAGVVAIRRRPTSAGASDEAAASVPAGASVGDEMFAPGRAGRAAAGVGDEAAAPRAAGRTSAGASEKVAGGGVAAGTADPTEAAPGAGDLRGAPRGAAGASPASTQGANDGAAATSAREQTAEPEAAAAGDPVATREAADSRAPAKAKPKKPVAKISGALIDTDAESIYEQCARAAARGECARVKQLVEQIAANDKQYLRRLNPASAIARCLAAP